MKRILTLIAFVITVTVGSINDVYATHLAGADITWTWTGNPNEYLLRFRLYRDCNGVPAPTDIPMCYSSASCGLSGTQTLFPVSNQVLTISSCVNIVPNCAGGVGMEEWIYEGVVLLPGNCIDWVFSYETCCRNGAISTLQNPLTLGMLIEAHFDNLNYPNDNSPEFLTVPITEFCVGNPFYFDQKAFDPDGDSLVYSLTSADESTTFNCPHVGAACPYVSPYSPANPVASSSPITIDTAGVIFFTPNLVQVAVVAVLVEEFDKATGAKIGSVKRDIQINITNQCNTIIPVYPNGIGGSGVSAAGITGNCGDNSIIIPFGIEFQCGSAVPSDFRVIDPFGFANPVTSAVPVNCTNGKSDSVELFLLHPLTAGVSYAWTKIGSDGNTLLSECGQSQPEDDTLKITVVDNSQWQPATGTIGCLMNQVTITFLEDIFCFSVAADGSDIILYDAGSSTAIPVSNAYGYCSPGGDRSNQVLVIPNGQQNLVGPVYVIVQSGTDNNTIANDCGRYLDAGDTLAILTVNNVIPVTLGSDQNVCSDFLPVTLNSGYTSGTFTWTNNGTVDPAATTGTYDINATGTYAVQVYSSPTCLGSDTINVTVTPTAIPSIGNDISICQGDPIPLLTATITSGTATDYAWFRNGQYILFANGPTYQPTQPGTYHVEVGNGTLCYGRDTMVLTISAQPVVSLTNQAICSANGFPVLDAGNPGAPSYQWSLNGNTIPGATSQTYQTVATGNASDIYSVVVGPAACPGSGSMTLTVVNPYNFNLNSQTVCSGQQSIQALDPGNAGSNATYSWTDVSGNPLASSQTYTPSSAGTYNLAITVASGGAQCVTNNSASVTINQPPTVYLSDDAICETDNAATFDAGNSGSGTTYVWTNSSGQQVSSAQVLSSTTAGTYTVLVTDYNGCTATDQATLTVEKLLDAPVVTCGLGSGTFKFVYTWAPISGSVSYEVSVNGGPWIAAATVGGNPTSHGTDEIVLNLSVRGIGNGLCKEGNASEPVACAPTLPNIITPNGDGVNDYFFITNIEFYPNNSFKVFNRWGKEVFTKNKYNNKDNVFVGKDLPDGTYFCILDLGTGDDPMTGTISIAR